MEKKFSLRRGWLNGILISTSELFTNAKYIYIQIHNTHSHDDDDDENDSRSQKWLFYYYYYSGAIKCRKIMRKVDCMYSDKPQARKQFLAYKNIYKKNLFSRSMWLRVSHEAGDENVNEKFAWKFASIS